jgi:hypothetical protein
VSNDKLSWWCRRGFHKWSKWDLLHSAQTDWVNLSMVPKMFRQCLRDGCSATQTKRPYDF